MRANSVKNLRKVLIINPFGIGDVLFTTPMISNLKLHNPGIHIGYICNRRAEGVLRTNTKVNQIYIFERDEFQKVYQQSKWRFLKKVWELISLIKAERYDAVLDVSLNLNFGFMGWVLGIPYRVGFNYKRRGLFLNQKIKIRGFEGKHVVDCYLELLSKLSIPVVEKKLQLNISSRDQQWAQEYIQKEEIKGDERLVVMMPGGGASWGKEARFKRWSPESYAKLADKMIENLGAAIILVGDQSEKDLCLEVEKWMMHPVQILCGQTTVSRLAALMAKTRITIVNDGGPLHIAVAAGARTASIFGPVDEKVYGPYPRDGHLVFKKELACRPCYRQFRRAKCDHVSCLSALTVDEVYQSIKNSFYLNQSENSDEIIKV